MRRLVFIRHAESTANVDGSLNCSIPGVPLSPRGERQARALAANWDGPPVHALWSSPMRRAEQTAGLLADRLGLPVRVHPLLPEFQIGDLHGRTDPESARRVDECFVRWQAGDLTWRAPGGESGADLVRRLRTAIGDILAELAAGGTAVVVSHGTLLRTGLPRLGTGLTPRYTLDNDLPNLGRITVDAPAGPAGEPAPLRCRNYAGRRVDGECAC